MVKSLKFGHCLEMAPEMARRMFVALVDTLPEIGPVDFLIPVPLHWTRRWRRGFNQSEAIAAELGRLAGVPAMQRNLIRIRRTRRQTALEPGERMRNVEHAFALAEPAALDGRRVLLIDDVFTTGATANVCARVLKEAGAEAVHVFTFARA